VAVMTEFKTWRTSWEDWDGIGHGRQVWLGSKHGCCTTLPSVEKIAPSLLHQGLCRLDPLPSEPHPWLRPCTAPADLHTALDLGCQHRALDTIHLCRGRSFVENELDSTQKLTQRTYWPKSGYLLVQKKLA
jgi:hypothetical protein